MTNYTGSVPDTPRAPDWRDNAACAGEDSEMFFASPLTAPGAQAVELAKATCRRCPVLEQCKQWAMETRQPFGVWGGTSEAERRAILRRRGIRLPIDDEEPRPERTLQYLLARRGQPTDDGHLIWKGSVPVRFEGRYRTPAQIAFAADRGRFPVGILRRSCTVKGCILPAHIADNEERNQRGTTKVLAS